MSDLKLDKNGKIVLYLLEMIVENDDAIICEPLGIYSNFDIAHKYLEKIHAMISLESGKEVVLNVLKFNLDDMPHIMESKNSLKNIMAEQLYSLYTSNVFEQMIDTDGSFSYQLTNKYKELLEKVISKNQEGGGDSS